MTTKTQSMKKLLTSVNKIYRCTICGKEHNKHHKAVQCADKCLQQQMTAKKVTN